MADFFQNGSITTLHHLTIQTIENIEQRLVNFSHRRPIALVLPSLYSELEGVALPVIIRELCKVPYLSEIAIGLDAANEAEFHKARDFFRVLPQNHQIIWHRGPRLQKLYQQLEDYKFNISGEGKGRNVWMSFGYLLARQKARIFAVHDCDILTYDRSMLARLVYPVASPAMGFRFVKGYYARISDRLNGRVSRLFITPLIRSLKMILGERDYLEYIDSFRYPLSGEIALWSDVARELRLPTDWGLEMGMLNEIYRNYSKNEMCQVDIADHYDHKHQELSANDSDSGLAKMSIDIAKSFYRVLASRGVVFSDQFFRTIKATYLRTALDFIEKYSNDAELNGLKYDLHAEEKAVEVFLKSIILAGDHYLSNPMELPAMPSWKRIESAIPGFFDDLIEAVALDNN
jgi:glucosyl-3-phosphoglycerate synthase